MRQTYSNSSFDPLTEDLLRYLERVHDVYLPRRLLDFAIDKEMQLAFQKTCERAVKGRNRVHSLHMGIGAPFTAMLAVRAGASRATICEKWPHLAAVYQTLIDTNGMVDTIRVINKTLSEMRLKEDFAFPPNLLILDSMGAGFSGNSFGAAIRFARKELLSPDAEIIPKGASLFAVPMELRTGLVCGFDLNAFNRYRWTPIYEEIRLDQQEYKPLADPFVCVEFDFLDPLIPEDKTFAVTPEHSGIWNATAWWYDLVLDEETVLATDPQSGTSSRRVQALQYLEKEVHVTNGEVFKIRVRHDGRHIRFEPESTHSDDSVISTVRLGPAVPHWHFPMIADETRNDKYEEAIVRAVRGVENPRALDIGTGTGLLAMMASRAGAAGVTACEMIPHMAKTAGEILETNRFGNKVHLVAKSSFDIEIPLDMKEKANILISETVDHSLLGEGFLAALQHAREFLLVDDPAIIPAGALVYASGVEIRTEDVRGFDFTPINLLRLNHYTCMDLNRVEHRRLTNESEVFRFDFYQRDFKPTQKVFELPVINDGKCNAIAFWYRLMLDKETFIDTGPDSGTIAWQQAVVFLDREVNIQNGDVLPIIGYYDQHMLGFSIDTMGCMLNGISMDSGDRPFWFKRLMEEETDFQSYTKEISERVRNAGEGAANQALKNIADNMDKLGFDPLIVSDFIIQIGYHLQ